MDSKMYVWTGVATSVSNQKGYTLFGIGGKASFTVLAPTREEATNAVNDLLGDLGGVAKWDCWFTSVLEVYERSQVIEHAEVTR